MKKCILTAAAILAVTGCSINLKSEPPVVNSYTVEVAATQEISENLNISLGIRDFSSAWEYNTGSMVLVTDSGEIYTAKQHRWSKPPSLMLPDILHGSIQKSCCVRIVFRQTSSVVSDFIIEGFVRRLGGRETAGKWLAVLDVDVSFISYTETGENFSRNYIFEMEIPEENYMCLAEAMNILAEQWVESVRLDLFEWINDRTTF